MCENGPRRCHGVFPTRALTSTSLQTTTRQTKNVITWTTLGYYCEHLDRTSLLTLVSTLTVHKEDLRKRQIKCGLILRFSIICELTKVSVFWYSTPNTPRDRLIIPCKSSYYEKRRVHFHPHRFLHPGDTCHCRFCLLSCGRVVCVTLSCHHHLIQISLSYQSNVSCVCSFKKNCRIISGCIVSVVASFH